MEYTKRRMYVRLDYTGNHKFWSKNVITDENGSLFNFVDTNFYNITSN